MTRELKERVFKRVVMVLLPGESHGQRNLVGYGPWGHKELDTTERLTHDCHLHRALCVRARKTRALLVRTQK